MAAVLWLGPHAGAFASSPLAGAQLQDARSSGDAHDYSASDGGYEESHALGKTALPPKEFDRDHVLVLNKEDDQQHQHHKTDGNRTPDNGCTGDVRVLNRDSSRGWPGRGILVPGTGIRRLRRIPGLRRFLWTHTVILPSTRGFIGTDPRI